MISHQLKALQINLIYKKLLWLTLNNQFIKL